MTNEVFGNLCSASCKKESSFETAIIPDNFFYINNEDLGAEYGGVDANYVAGNRSEAQKSIKKALPAPVGSLNLDVEPTTIGHFLNGLVGGLTSGQYLPMTSPSASFTVGETVTGGTSSQTATVVFDGGDFLLVSGASGDFTDGETITGGSSSSNATLTRFTATVYGHVGNMPATLGTTYTVQINLVNSAVRYYGVRFIGFDPVGMEDNKITAGIKCMAKGQFRHARVKTQLTTGSGSKVIEVDQVTGLVNSDSIKVYRPSTDTFLDFSASGVKTHSINSFDPAALTITVTDIQTQLEPDDLIMLAPQTPSYSTQDGFIWYGGSTMYLGDDLDNLAAEQIEEFSIMVANELQERHAASGSNLVDRFPAALLQKGYRSRGSIKAYYKNERFIRLARLDTAQAVRWITEGAEIGSSGEKYTLRMDFSEVRFEPFNPNVANGEIMDEEISWKGFHSNADGREARVLLINEISSY